MERNVDENLLRDLILCDPITRKGKESLNNLGLTSFVTPDYFYKYLRVPSIYENGREYKEIVISAPEKDSLFYQYTIDKEQYDAIRSHQQRFSEKFASNGEGDSPLIILGVAGNGKTIEINRIIRKQLDNSLFKDYKKTYAYIDLEKAKKKITYGYSFSVPDEHNAAWGVCACLLSDIMDYIATLDTSESIIWKTYINDLRPYSIGSTAQRKVLKTICENDFFPHLLNKHFDRKAKHREKVFFELNKLIYDTSPKQSIQNLLEMLMLIMYCSNRDKRNIIVIDNLEQFIMLDNNRLQIPDTDVALVYSAISDAIESIDGQLSRNNPTLFWERYKIIILPRRTTLGLLHPQFLQDPARNKQRATDITGYFQISDIWEKKKQYLWIDRLEKQFPGKESKTIIQIMDIITSGGAGTLGWSYQSLIAPLMSYGIRRNAYAQAHAAIRTFEYLSNKTTASQTMGVDAFISMMDDVEAVPSSARYMLRRALIEIQLKWPLSQPRWRELQLGRLGKPCTHEEFGTEVALQEYELPDDNAASFVRRILTCLSYHSNGYNTEQGWKKTPSDMFSTVSLYDLLVGVLVSPRNKENGIIFIPDDAYLPFSKVLIALSDMYNDSTKSSPYVILNVKDSGFHSVDTDSAERLADLLKEIISSGPAGSRNDAVFNPCAYGARITDAGFAFLCDWQPSFSFFAAIACYTIPPLFFLKNTQLIEYVLKTVYEVSDKICVKYESEAESFCGNTDNISLRDGQYLPQGKGLYKTTFRQRVKKLHMDHLDLYQDYINRCYKEIGFSKEDADKLVGTKNCKGIISNYRDKYSNWNVGEGAVECF